MEKVCPRCQRPVPVEKREDGKEVAKLYIIKTDPEEIRCDQCRGE